MHGMHLEELIGRLRQGGLDFTAEEVADAVWLAQWLAPPSPESPAAGQASDASPSATSSTSPMSSTSSPSPASSSPSPSPGDPDTGREPGAGAGPGSSPASRDRSGEWPDGEDGAGARPSGSDRSSGAVSLHAVTGEGSGGRPGGPLFPVRAPAAAALPGLLGLEQALRVLGRYRVTAAAPPGDEIDEEATAEHAAAGGIVLPVPRRGRHRRCDIQLLMDTGPAMSVWQQMVDELRQACQQSGAFGSVRVHHLYDNDGGTPLVGTTVRAGRHTRLRTAEELHDPTGRRLTLVISDCVGPMWQNGGAQRLLHEWPRSSPVAVVQPLPSRLWGRTALPAEAGLLVRQAELGGLTVFLPDEEPWDDPAPGARPVPVLQPTPDAFAAWARLLSGVGPTRQRAWAAWVTPGQSVGELPPQPDLSTPGDEELLSVFRASASPGAVRLAVYLAAAPLTLPVMQLVQRAMLPDTGPTELAEVLLGGLLRQVPGTDEHPCFVYPARVQELLLGSLDQGAAGLVLKHCSAYVERHFGRGTRNFAALAAVRLTERATASEQAPAERELTQGYGEADVEAELFARIPARVLGFYLPEQAGPDPLAEAERLLDQWRALADPAVLRRARERAEAAALAVPEGGAEGARARIVRGRILRAEAGTVAARTGDRRTELLRAAAAEFAAALRDAPADSSVRADAALELAACEHELWRLTGERDHLTAALDVLAQGDRPWPDAAHRARLLRRGRLLLDLGRPGDAVTELQEGCAQLDATDAPAKVRADALTDLTRALRGAGADPERVREVLRRAEEAAGDDPALRLPVLAAEARFHDDVGDHAAADHAYETAVMLAPADSACSRQLLTAWGESLLRRASARDGAGVVDRAENVLREALKALPGRSPDRARLQGLVGSALAQRFRHLGFLPDLFESRHLLGQVVRAPVDAGVRAEAWLQLARVKVELWRRAGTPVLGDALQAYDGAEREARAAYGARPGSVTAARAGHGRAAILALMGRYTAAQDAYRAARELWSRLVAALREVDWHEVEATRRAADALRDAPGSSEGAGRERTAVSGRDRTAVSGEHRTPDEDPVLPPWYPWSEQWINWAEFDRG